MWLHRAQSPTTGTCGFAIQQESAHDVVSLYAQNTAERQDVTTLTQDVRDAAGCLEDNEQDQSLTVTHKRAQGSMAATFLMYKIVQKLSKHSY